MRLPVRLRPPCSHCTVPGWKSGAFALALLASSGAVQAQETLPEAPVGEAEEQMPIGFEADGISYDDASDSVTAFGNVVVRRGQQSVRADKVVWDRKTGEVTATGNIRFVDGDGNQLFTDSLTLDDELRAGAMQNMLLALREGGRLAASSGSRAPDGTVVLSNAVYSACAVEDSAGCPVNPSWRITAERVIYDDAKKLIRFKGARLELFGARLLPLPGLVLASDGRPISGLLIPDVRLSASNGVEFSQTYYKRLANNAELGLTGYVY
ncbi:MAG: LPS-assembly protein LptD, partial [Novosphingobium sp.]